MRAQALVGALFALAAAGCGGGGTVAPPPPPPPQPPPAPPGPPASVAVQAGGDQTGEPGTATPVRPAVVVRDASGRAVPNVSVSFAVDSGGGALTGPTANTGADGVATVGAWTLGPTEGRHVVSAATAGLTPAKFVATAAVATRVTNDTAMVTGTIEIKTGALAGTKLVVPAGAFPGSKTWKLEQRSSSDWVRRPGVNPIGAALHITSPDSAVAATPMMLTLPAVVPPGTKPFVLIRDPVTNAVEVLTTVTVDPTSITVAVHNFNGRWIRSSTPTAGLRAARGWASSTTAATGYDAVVVVSAIPVADLDLDVDTGFRPGTDDWDFQVLATSIDFPSPKGSIELGKVLTQMAYFDIHRPTMGSLFNKYAEIRGVRASNRSGIRASALNGAAAPATTILASLTTIRNSMRPGFIDQTFYDVLKANLLVTRLPQLVTAPDGTGWVPFTAYRVVGGRVDLANPWAPGDQSQSVQFAAGQFGPFSPIVGPAPKALPWVGSTPVGQWVHMDDVAADIPHLQDDATDPFKWFPEATIKARGGFIEDTILYLGHVGDTTRFWVECPLCKTGIPTAVGAGRLEPFQVFYTTAPGGNLNTLSSVGNQGYLLTEPAAQDLRFGFLILEPDGSNGYQWLDFQWIRVKRWTLSVSAPGSAPGQPTTLTATLAGPTLKPPHQFVWTIGTGASAQTVTTATPTATVTSTAPRPVPVRVEMQRISDNKVLAVGTDSIGPPRWRITSFVQTSFSNNLNVPSLTPAHLAQFEASYRADMWALRDSLTARPAGGTIDLFAAGQGPATIWVNPFDVTVVTKWLLTLREAPGSPSMYLSFPLATGMIARPLAAIGAPTIVPPSGFGLPYKPVDFINTFTTSTTTPTTYTGMAATKAFGQDPAFAAPIYQTNPLASLEVAATVTPTGGLSGTITFVYHIVCAEKHSASPAIPFPACPFNLGVAGQVRRVFAFTAAPD